MLWIQHKVSKNFFLDLFGIIWSENGMKICILELSNHVQLELDHDVL
jgi:hypothetical protein